MFCSVFFNIAYIFHSLKKLWINSDSLSHTHTHTCIQDMKWKRGFSRYLHQLTTKWKRLFCQNRKIFFNFVVINAVRLNFLFCGEVMEIWDFGIFFSFKKKKKRKWTSFTYNQSLVYTRQFFFRSLLLLSLVLFMQRHFTYIQARKLYIKKKPNQKESEI